MTLSDTDLVTRLRDQRARADELAPPPVDLAQRVRDRAREQRRRRVALTAAGIAAALVFVGLPALAPGVLDDGSRRSDAASPSTRRAPAPSHLDVATRGSLAGDEEWLAGVRELSWAPEDAETFPPEVEIPDPAVADRTVVFAGDVPGGRIALVMARTRVGQLVQAWFAGPERARPADMRLAGFPGQAPRLEPLAFVTTPDPDTDDLVLVLVASPGDEAEVLTGREVTAAGTMSELWEPVPLQDGAGALALGSGVAIPFGLELRVTRSGQQAPVFAQLQFDDAALGRSFSAPVEVADPRGLLELADADQLHGTVHSLAAHYGLPAARLDPTLLVAGPVSPGSRTEVLLVGITFPSGATTANLAVYWEPDAEGGMMSVHDLDLAPAGIPLVDRLLVVATSTAVVVSGPAAGVTAEFYRDDGTLLTTVPLVAGAGTAPLTPPALPPAAALATVRVLDRAGNVLAESPVEQVR